MTTEAETPTRGLRIVLSGLSKRFGTREVLRNNHLGIVFKTPCRPQWREGW